MMLRIAMAQYTYEYDPEYTTILQVYDDALVYRGDPPAIVNMQKVVDPYYIGGCI